MQVLLSLKQKTKQNTEGIKEGREIKKELIEETEKRRVKIKDGEKSGRNRNTRIWLWAKKLK